METTDYSYLVKGWDEETSIKFTEDQRKQAVDIWAGIYNEYCKLTSNNKALLFYSTSKRLLYLETRKAIGAKLLTQLLMRDMDKETFLSYIETLRMWEFPYKGEEKTLEQLEEIGRMLRAADNEIGLKKDELKKMRETGEPIPLEKQVVQVEQALGRNLVDPRKTSVVKWVFLLGEVKSITEARLKQARKNR